MLIPAVTAYMWRFMFQYDGIVNYLLGLVGLGPVNWATTVNGLASVVMVVVWENAAFSLIVFLAGLQSIDPELWAAAKVDGAGPLQRFVHVTLPLMRPFILIVLVIRGMDLLCRRMIASKLQVGDLDRTGFAAPDRGEYVRSDKGSYVTLLLKRKFDVGDQDQREVALRPRCMGKPNCPALVQPRSDRHHT